MIGCHVFVQIGVQMTAGVLAPPTEAPMPEYGHGLTAAEAHAGWVSLFDGKTPFGWIGAKVERDRLVGGTTAAHFGACQLRVEVVHGGTLRAGGREIKVARGTVRVRVTGPVGPIRLGDGVAVRVLSLRPLGLEEIFNGRDLHNWKRLCRPDLPENEKAQWTVHDGVLHVVGGPGGLEYQGRFGEFILQIDVRTRAAHANGGVFFRNQPGLCLVGYEAQILNVGEKDDPSRPVGYTTGAIDDRRPARRLVSVDHVFFTMTVVANGPHLATWVNGYGLVDWTDTRPRHDNPRRGLRTEPGTIQFQAHDPKTNIEFRNIRVVALK